MMIQRSNNHGGYSITVDFNSKYVDNLKVRSIFYSFLYIFYFYSEMKRPVWRMARALRTPADEKIMTWRV